MEKRIGRREFIGGAAGGIVAAGLAGTGLLAATKKLAQREKLNVLFIMSDQHNVRAMGCSGATQVKTPNLDKLAASGVRFDNAFCQTGQCCPARATILTGRYAHSHGLRWNNVMDPVETETYVASIFRDAGYATATIGKHHMKAPPAKVGFAKTIAMGQYHQHCRRNNKAPWLDKSGDWMDGAWISGPVGASAADNDYHPMGYWTSETLKFIRTNKDKPFCLWYSFYGPHTPIAPSKPWANMYDPAKLALGGSFDVQRDDMPQALKQLRRDTAKLSTAQHRQVLAYYYGLVSQMDYNIGRVLDELDKLGLAEKTIVVYTADHGEMMAEQRSWTKTVSCYDATVRVPLIVRLPKAVGAGKVRSELVGSIDLTPTLCDLAGLKTPAKVQGKSLTPLLRGEKTDWRKTIFSEIGYPGKHHGRCVMARTHSHKLIHNPNLRGKGRIDELFDLKLDPWETTNQIDNPAYAKVVAELRAELATWDKTTDHAPMFPIKAGRKKRRRRQPAGEAK